MLNPGNLAADVAARLLLRPMMSSDAAEAVSFPEVPGSRTDARIPTRHGPVRCVVYAPAEADAGAGVFINFHGGGFIAANIEQDDPWCRYLAAEARVHVVNVDYAVAPEARFPVAVEQSADVVSWAAGRNDWDGDRLAVGGQSCGGALATAVARMSLEGDVPPVRLQVLQYPYLDLVTPGKDKPAATSKAMIRPWLSNILNPVYIPQADQRRHRYASPAWGSNDDGLEGMAPAVVVTCAMDRLRNEGARYAESLQRAGALRAHLDLAGLDHAYNLGGAPVDRVESTYAELAAHVTAEVGSPDA